MPGALWIASGLAVADPVPFEDALTLIRDHKLDRLDFVIPHLNRIANGDVSGPVRPGDPILDRVTTRILASNEQCRRAAASYIRSALPRLDYINAPDLDGEATEMAHRLAALVLKQHTKNESMARPFGFVVGGETTVTLDMSNPGKGGVHKNWHSPLR